MDKSKLELIGGAVGGIGGVALAITFLCNPIVAMGIVLILGVGAIGVTAGVGITIEIKKEIGRREREKEVWEKEKEEMVRKKKESEERKEMEEIIKRVKRVSKLGF